MHKTIKIFAVSVFGLLLAFLVIESILRITNSFPLLDDFLLHDASLLYKFKPDLKSSVPNADGIVHEVETVSLGFDGIGFRDDGINGEPYAIVVGDSFSLGMEVNMEDTWAELLEQKLGKDVANMALYGYGSIQEKRMLELYGTKLNPKLVIWGFFANDFSDDFEADKMLKNEETIPEKLYSEFSTVRLIWTSIGKLKRASDSIAYSDSNLDFTLWPNQWRYLYPITPDSNAVQVGEKLTKSNILEAKQIAESRGAEFVLIIFPTKDEVYWQYVKDKVKSITLEDLDYPVRVMKQFCEENNILCLDLTQPLINQSSEGRQLYFPLDGHFNENGNRVVSDIVYQFLMKT